MLASSLTQWQTCTYIVCASDHGFATHFIPSRRIPTLLSRLSALEDPYLDAIDRTLEELSSERQPDDPDPPCTGSRRMAIDTAFRHNSVEEVIEELKLFVGSADKAVSDWAQATLDALHLRSPTSLKVALEAIRRGRNMTLFEALEMELRIATAYCVSGALVFSTIFGSGLKSSR